MFINSSELTGVILCISVLSDDNVMGEKQIPNFGSIVDERELARKLLQRCSDLHFPNSMQSTFSLSINDCIIVIFIVVVMVM